ncbi:hypothetical protein HK098_004096 [Nowakowskiella sp. JEL0407]|nr:hypothetical protein HK098_004096 [Nowakowskiella sp. JEL0407]
MATQTNLRCLIVHSIHESFNSFVDLIRKSPQLETLKLVHVEEDDYYDRSELYIKLGEAIRELRNLKVFSLDGDFHEKYVRILVVAVELDNLECVEFGEDCRDAIFVALELWTHSRLCKLKRLMFYQYGYDRPRLNVSGLIKHAPLLTELVITDGEITQAFVETLAVAVRELDERAQLKSLTLRSDTYSSDSIDPRIISKLVCDLPNVRRFDFGFLNALFTRDLIAKFKSNQRVLRVDGISCADLEAFAEYLEFMGERQIEDLDIAILRADFANLLLDYVHANDRINDIRWNCGSFDIGDPITFDLVSPFVKTLSSRIVRKLTIYQDNNYGYRKFTIEQFLEFVENLVGNRNLNHRFEVDLKRFVSLGSDIVEVFDFLLKHGIEYSTEIFTDFQCGLLLKKPNDHQILIRYRVPDRIDSVF